ncbi:MAG TPA: tail-specific protease [Desulfobulbus sp.]|nr:tail-specific protease [Desulfobulbus sp.]
MRVLRTVSSLLIVIFLTSATAWSNIKPVEFDAARNRLIAYMLSHQLPAQHFSHVPFDDQLSKKAFELYLRQLDPRKRFLLKSDVDELGAFSEHIDDELRRGRMVLPDAGMQILDERIRQVKTMLGPIMKDGFDPNRKDYLESDPKKITWAANQAELRDRWRRVLKLQVLDEYLNAVEKKKKEKKPVPEADAGKITKTKAWKTAMETVRKRNIHYLDRLLRESRQDHYNRYFDAVARAFDPHTNYMPPTSKEDFDIHMSGSLEGIGALLREDDGHIKVVRIIPGSAAERQGQLHAEDTILAVAEKGGEPVEISEMRIREAVSYIRGPKGTEVILTVQKPDGSRQVIPIVRDVVQIEETYVKSTVLKDDRGVKIGYIRIPSFYRDFSASRENGKSRNVTDDTRHELVRLKKEGIGGLILDLRNNGGGALTDAVDISGLFLPGGPVVQVKNSQGMIRVLDDEDAQVVYDGPLIVLVNQFSASASEILAAALQDYGRALIIGGKHTHGKGTVQALVDLNRNLPLLHLKKYEDLGALKVTIQKFYRINGGSTQYKGVEPDIVVPSMFDYLKTGEKNMENSLPWDTVENVAHNSWQGDRFDLATVRQQSRKWIKLNKKFQTIKEEAAKAKERSEQTRVADFLTGMEKERAEAERAREDAAAAGLINLDAAPGSEDAKEKKSLDEELAEDPFVGLALFLMDDVAGSGTTAGEVK